MKKKTHGIYGIYGTFKVGKKAIYDFVVKWSEVKCEKWDLTVQFGDKTGYYIDVMNT